MTWQQLKALPEKELIETINKLVAEHGSVNKTCKFLKIPGTTVKGHLGNLGYSFSVEGRKYKKEKPLKEEQDSSDNIDTQMKQQNKEEVQRATNVLPETETPLKTPINENEDKTKAMHTEIKEESKVEELTAITSTKEESYLGQLLSDIQDKKQQLETAKTGTKGRPTKEGRRKATVYLHDEGFQDLQVWALRNKCSASDVLNALMMDFLGKHDK